MGVILCKFQAEFLIPKTLFFSFSFNYLWHLSSNLLKKFAGKRWTLSTTYKHRMCINIFLSILKLKMENLFIINLWNKMPTLSLSSTFIFPLPLHVCDKTTKWNICYLFFLMFCTNKNDTKEKWVKWFQQRFICKGKANTEKKFWPTTLASRSVRRQEVGWLC